VSSGASCTVDVEDLRDRIVCDSGVGEVEGCWSSSSVCGIIRRDFGTRAYFLDKRRNLLCRQVSFCRVEISIGKDQHLMSIAGLAHLKKLKRLSMMKVSMCEYTI
jgi:hypothetical protein